MTRPSLAQYQATGRTFIVAEIAQAHDGSLGILHSFIDACAGAGVDAVKVQIHIAEAESSPLEPFRKRFSYVDDTRFAYWSRMGFTEDQWREVARHCGEAGVEFLATPFSVAAVALLERVGVTRYKVGSGDIANTLLLDRIAATGREAILSTGLATDTEISDAVDLMRPNGVAVLQCTTKYPTEAPDVGLGAIAEIRERYGCPAGLSDHSGTIYPGLAAVALGASVVEAHVTFDRRMFGPDAKASLTVDEFATLVEGARFIEQARGGTVAKPVDEAQDALRGMFGRSLAVNRDLPAGHVLTADDLESKKPAGQGLNAAAYRIVLGRRLARGLKRWDFLRDEDLA